MNPPNFNVVDLANRVTLTNNNGGTPNEFEAVDRQS